MAGILDYLGETAIPQIFDSLQKSGLTDQMVILRDVKVSDGAGGQVKSSAAEVNDDLIPCTVVPLKVGNKAIQADALTSTNQVIVTFASHRLGNLIDILPSDRIQVVERGNQPERLYRIIDLKPYSGVKYEAICVVENNQ